MGLYATSPGPRLGHGERDHPERVRDVWAYTGGASAGSLNLTVPAGAPPGTTYELRLFSNNTYTRLATSAPFSVT